MTADAARMKRLAKAQRALADVAMARRAAAQSAYEASAAEAGEILGALNGASPLHGVAVAAMASSLRRNGRATEQLRRAGDEAVSLHLRADRTADVLTERAADAAASERAKAERAALEALCSVARPPARSRTS